MVMTKKGKKPKAKKAGKKPVKKTQRVFSGTVGSARIEKIDRRLRPTPDPKLVKIDPMLRNPLKIVDAQRTQIYPYSQIPTYMFSGQDTGNLNRQFDILKSKEQQLEAKVTQIQQKGLYDEILRDMRILDNNMSILDNEYSEQKYNGLKKKLMEINRTIPKDEPSLFLFYEKLSERLENIKKSYDEFELDAGFSEIDFGEIPAGDEFVLKEVKSTNTLLDDKIHNNNLVDEAEILMEEIRSKEVKKPVTLPNLEQAFLLGEIQSTKIKAPVILPTFEEAVTVVKKSRGRPKKEKVNELVEVKQTNTLLDDKIIDNILDDSGSLFGEEYDPQASTRRRQERVNQARLEREQAERAFDEKMRLNSLRISEEVARAKEQRGMMEEDEPYQTAMWRIVGTTKKRSDLL
jgi:hypothetical protein